MHTVMLLVEIRGKQNAKASKINAFIKNGVDPIARSNNKRRLPKGSLFFVIRSSGMRSHEKVGPTRTRGGREYAGETESRARTQRQRISLAYLIFAT